MNGQSLSALERAEPTPYELYIRLQQLQALWPTGAGGWAGQTVAACGLQAAHNFQSEGAQGHVPIISRHGWSSSFSL